MQAHDFERQQEIGKYNCRIHDQRFGGSDSNLGSEFRLFATLNQSILLADSAILGHVAPGLTHEPDRSSINGLRLAGLYEARLGSGHETLNVAFSRRPSLLVSFPNSLGLFLGRYIHLHGVNVI